MLQVNDYVLAVTTLVLVHSIADFPLQTDALHAWKIRSLNGLLVHSGVHVCVGYVLIQNPSREWGVLLILGMSHCAVDWVKVHVPMRKKSPAYILDQSAHIFVIVLLALWRPHLTPVLAPWLVYISAAGMVMPNVLMYLWIWSGDKQAACQPFSFELDRSVLFFWAKWSGWVVLAVVGVLAMLF